MRIKKVILCAIAASMLLAGWAANDGTGASGEENSQSVQTEEKRDRWKEHMKRKNNI